MRQTNSKPLPFWASARSDCKEKRFIQVGNSLLFSEQWRSLSYGAQTLYLCCMMESGGQRQFEFPQSKASAYGFPSASFRRYMRELTSQGFVSCNSAKYMGSKNTYAFSKNWKGTGYM